MDSSIPSSSRQTAPSFGDKDEYTTFLATKARALGDVNVLKLKWEDLEDPLPSEEDTESGSNSETFVSTTPRTMSDTDSRSPEKIGQSTTVDPSQVPYQSSVDKITVSRPPLPERPKPMTKEWEDAWEAWEQCVPKKLKQEKGSNWKKEFTGYSVRDLLMMVKGVNLVRNSIALKDHEESQELVQAALDSLNHEVRQLQDIRLAFSQAVESLTILIDKYTQAVMQKEIQSAALEKMVMALTDQVNLLKSSVEPTLSSNASIVKTKKDSLRYAVTAHVNRLGLPTEYTEPLLTRFTTKDTGELDSIKFINCRSREAADALLSRWKS